MAIKLPVHLQASLPDLGEELGRLRLCSAEVQQAMERSLASHGQITPLVVRERHRGYEVIDGFKRLRAARTLGWTALWVHVADVRGAQAKVQILHCITARASRPAMAASKGPFVLCDVTSGAGVTITGNFNATNKRCDLFGGNRYIVKGEPDPEAMFKCIATVGEGPKTPVPMTVMQHALEPDMLSGGCNDGFLRKDALLAVVVLNGEQDNLTPGTPQDWYDALVAAKGGNKEAVRLEIVQKPSSAKGSRLP